MMMSTPALSSTPLDVSASCMAVISTLGQDRSGLVAALTEAIMQCEGNIEDSSMTRLAGQFAMIVIVALPSPQHLTRLKQQLIQLDDTLQLRSQCCLMPETTTALPHPAPYETPYLLTVGGADRTGITAAVSQVLAQFEANITDLNAHCIHNKQTTAYIMVVEFTLNTHQQSLQALESSLQQLGQTMALDVNLRPVDVFTL
ncbi:MAG: glycine cleavage system protein R [Vampirovibrionales bacterium]